MRYRVRLTQSPPPSASWRSTSYVHAAGCTHHWRAYPQRVDRVTGFAMRFRLTRGNEGGNRCRWQTTLANNHIHAVGSRLHLAGGRLWLSQHLAQGTLKRRGACKFAHGSLRCRQTLRQRQPRVYNRRMVTSGDALPTRHRIPTSCTLPARIRGFVVAKTAIESGPDHDPISIQYYQPDGCSLSFRSSACLINLEQPVATGS
jgi:hypothetical protein